MNVMFLPRVDISPSNFCEGRQQRVVTVRLIARLDVKGANVIKGIHLEGLRKVGDPNELARKYYDAGIDEILYMDSVASLYGRNSLFEIIRRATEEVFVPVTVGGGIRSTEDVRDALRAGADKVAVNTAAIKCPDLIRQIAGKFGSQCMVLSIEAKRVAQSRWEAYCDNGREKTGLDAIEWAYRGYEMGAGEILVTSVDQEGTAKGFDCELVRNISSQVPVPVIASGGMGNPQHLVEVVRTGKADAVAMAHVLHYDKCSLTELRRTCSEAGISVRTMGSDLDAM